MTKTVRLIDEDSGKTLDVPEHPETEVIELPAGLWNAVASIIMALPAPAFGDVPGAAVAKLINDIAAAKRR